MLGREGQDPRLEAEIAAGGAGLIDFLTGDAIPHGEEERVRQRYLRLLHFQYGYPKDTLARQVAIYSGRNQAKDERGQPIFADIAVYWNGEARRASDQGNIKFVVETKQPDEESGYNQLVSYIFNTSASGGVWTNGAQIRWYRRLDRPQQRLTPSPNVPRFGETWDALGRRKKSQLLPLIDVRRTLERCHNKLHRRGAEGDDLTMDMVRILLAKARDEERDGEDTLFYATADELENDPPSSGGRPTRRSSLRGGS